MLAPLIGMTLGFALMVAILWIFRGASPGRVDHWFRRLQLVSAAAYSLGHGGNDAQKTMGIIAGALVAGGYLGLDNGHLPIPLWVVLAAHAAIALGTLSGGWRIIHTMGSKITKLQPVGGFAAETAGRDLALHRDAPRRAGQHDAHDHRRDHRRRIDPPPLGRALGHRRPHRLGVDPHDSRLGLDRRDHLLGHGGDYGSLNRRHDGDSDVIAVQELFTAEVAEHAENSSAI